MRAISVHRNIKVNISNNFSHHSNEEIDGHWRNMYCPLLYLNPFGLDMTMLKTSPGRKETCIRN